MEEFFGSKIQPNVKTESKDNEEEGKGQIEELVLIGTDGALTILVSLSLLRRRWNGKEKTYFVIFHLVAQELVNEVSAIDERGKLDEEIDGRDIKANRSVGIEETLGFETPQE